MLQLDAAPRTTARIHIRLADEADRRDIFRMRHEVYARELAQHQVNDAGVLHDSLDAVNTYLVARIGGELAGFISLTPPGGAYSIDKYLARPSLPFDIDDGLYEVRLLTVAAEHRHTPLAALLMWAALRWVEGHDGRRIVAIGRHEVLPTYFKAGLRGTGIHVRSGAVRFELLHGAIDELRREAARFRGMLDKVRSNVNWQLDMPFESPPACYHGGAFFDAIGSDFATLKRRDAIVNADVLDAWFDPSPHVVAALHEHLPWLLRTSPPTGCEGLIRTIAEVRDVPPACVLPGAGSSDLIFLALRQWLTPRSHVLILDPMYGEYAHVLEQVMGCRVDRFALRREQSYDVDVAALSRIIARGYDMVVLVNPNSPTGRHVPREEMMQLLACVDPRTVVWVDETYIEYAGAGQSLERFAAASRNVVVCKSMSKVYALSGARAAYLVGPVERMAALRPLSPPWAVSLPGQVAAVEALKDQAYYQQQYAATAVLRRELAASLTALGFDVVNGVANFLLCHVPPGKSVSDLVQACRSHGVFIRDVSNMGSNLHDAVRIAVKDAEDNRRIVAALAAAP